MCWGSFEDNIPSTPGWLYMCMYVYIYILVHNTLCFRLLGHCFGHLRSAARHEGLYGKLPSSRTCCLLTVAVDQTKKAK